MFMFPTFYSHFLIFGNNERETRLCFFVPFFFLGTCSQNKGKRGNTKKVVAKCSGNKKAFTHRSIVPFCLVVLPSIRQVVAVKSFHSWLASSLEIPHRWWSSSHHKIQCTLIVGNPTLLAAMESSRRWLTNCRKS